MQYNVRHTSIIEELDKSGRVEVAKLSSLCGVSQETIRRDLASLEAVGRLRRVHGGAVPFRADLEQPMFVRSRVRPREKALVGRIARGIVHDGMSIFIDTGSTPTAFARTLADARQLTVTTNSLDVARTLAQWSGIRVKVTPGWVRGNDLALVGSDTLDFVRRFVFDVAFMGIAACNAEHGWMDYGEEESDLRRILLEQSRAPVLLADESKFGRLASVRTFDLTTKLTVVTSRAPSEPFAGIFKRSGVEVCYRAIDAEGEHRDRSRSDGS